MTNTLNAGVSLAVLAAFVIGLVSSASAQTPLSLDHFDGAEEWPVYRPGEIDLDNDKLGFIRVAYDAEFAIPGGVLELANYIDLMDVMFNGKPADWMQWTFTSETEGEGMVANMDTLIMDKETGALWFRMLPSGPGSAWGGPYNFIGVSEREVKRIILSDKDMPKTEAIAIDGAIFDFGGLPFVFPFMDLKKGQGLRLKSYQQSGADGVQFLDVKVIGPTKIVDTHGKEHDVMEIQTLPPSRSTRVSFYVSDEVPYFYGYDYRKVEDGVSLFKMTYRGYVSTEIDR